MSFSTGFCAPTRGRENLPIKHEEGGPISSSAGESSSVRTTASHPQDALGVAVRDLLAVRVADRKLFQEFHSRGVGLVGPVHGEQDIVSAEREQRAQERGLVPVAAGGDEQIVL